MGYIIANDSVQDRTCSSRPILQRRISQRLKTLTPVSALQQRGLRFYKPEIGRWLGRDLIEEGDLNQIKELQANLYAFVRNQFGVIDSLGLMEFEYDWRRDISIEFTGVFLSPPSSSDMPSYTTVGVYSTIDLGSFSPPTSAGSPVIYPRDIHDYSYLYVPAGAFYVRDKDQTITASISYGGRPRIRTRGRSINTYLGKLVIEVRWKRVFDVPVCPLIITH